MKRKDLIRYLHSQNCELVREGANHSWWHNPAQNKRSAVPRHTEVRDKFSKKDLQRFGHSAREINL